MAEMPDHSAAMENDSLTRTSIRPIKSYQSFRQIRQFLNPPHSISDTNESPCLPTIIRPPSRPPRSKSYQQHSPGKSDALCPAHPLTMFFSPARLPNPRIFRNRSSYILVDHRDCPRPCLSYVQRIVQFDLDLIAVCLPEPRFA
jgi:hypothetical protein